MIQAVLLKAFFKAVFKHPIMLGLIKYKEEPNSADIKGIELEQKVTDIGFRVTASVDLMKQYAETIENTVEKLKSIEKTINTFENKLKQIDKIAHPPAVSPKKVKELTDFMNTIKNKKWF